MIVDDGGDATLLIHKGYEAENAFLKDGTLPDPSTADNEEVRIVLQIIKDGLEAARPTSGTRWPPSLLESARPPPGSRGCRW